MGSKPAQIYCVPKFTRSSGLGNRLFPWARCYAFSVTNNVPMLAPQWAHIRKAPFLKGGIDYRKSIYKILLWRNFVNPGGFIGGYRRYRILRNCRPLLEDEAGSARPWEDVVVEFQGDGNFFDDLRINRELIAQGLEKITRPAWLEFVRNTVVPPLVLNIRRGKDFVAAGSEEDYFTKGAIRTPLDWFIQVLLSFRKKVGYDAPAGIISDGTREDLQQILALPHVSLLESPAAITDLLLLSQAKLILGSGGSSFTAWGAFLSGADAVTIPGQSLQWFKVSADHEKQLVGTIDARQEDDSTLLKIAARYRQRTAN